MKGDFRRLLVGAFAKADADAVTEQVINVGLAAVKIRLDDGSHHASVARLAMEFANKAQRALGVGRAFHVDAHEAFQRGCFCYQAADQFASEVLLDIEPHVGQLQADVAVEPLRRDVIE